MNSVSSCARSRDEAAGWWRRTETTLYDEWGERREDVGLAELFGARTREGWKGRLQKLVPGEFDGTRRHSFHPWVEGLEEAGRIINGSQRVKVETRTLCPMRR